MTSLTKRVKNEAEHYQIYSGVFSGKLGSEISLKASVYKLKTKGSMTFLADQVTLNSNSFKNHKYFIIYITGNNKPAKIFDSELKELSLLFGRETSVNKISIRCPF
jgi:hypothetical protein